MDWKIYAFLDLWSLAPNGYKLVKEIVNEETNEITCRLTAFQRKDLCVDVVDWIKDFFSPSIGCISMVWLEPNRLQKANYVRLAKILDLECDSGEAKKVCLSLSPGF
jgi:hypothetical protein